MIKQIIISLMTIILIVGIASAAKSKSKVKKKDTKPYPTGCQTVGFKYQHGALVLDSGTKATPQSMFFLHNISNKNIELYQARDGSKPYIMHSHNVLHANKWAAYATDQKQTKFICIKSTRQSYAGEVLDCEKLLKICQYPKVKFALNNRGNYWATTNRSKNSAVRTVIRQGTLLRWW